MSSAELNDTCLAQVIDPTKVNDPDIRREIASGAALASNQRRLRGLRQLVCRNLTDVSVDTATAAVCVAPARYFFTVSVVLCCEQQQQQQQSSHEHRTQLVYRSEFCWLLDGHAAWEPLDAVELACSGLCLSCRWLTVCVYCTRCDIVRCLFTWRVYLPALVPVDAQWPLASNSLLFSHNGQWLTERQCVLDAPASTAASWWQMRPPLTIYVPVDAAVEAAAPALMERLHRCQHERRRCEVLIEHSRREAGRLWRHEPVRRRREHTTLLARRRQLLVLLRREVAQRRAAVAHLHERLVELRRQVSSGGETMRQLHTALSHDLVALDTWRRRCLTRLYQHYLQQLAQLNWRRRRLCDTLHVVFPIARCYPSSSVAVTAGSSSVQLAASAPSTLEDSAAADAAHADLCIVNVCVPDADQLISGGGVSPATTAGVCERGSAAVALSHVAHVLCLLSWLLHVPLPCRLQWRQAEFSVSDPQHQQQQQQQQRRQGSVDSALVLSGGGRDSRHLGHALQLLNKNISQLRLHCALDTPRPSMSLANLRGLLNACRTSSQSSSQVETVNIPCDDSQWLSSWRQPPPRPSSAASWTDGVSTTTSETTTTTAQNSTDQPRGGVEDDDVNGSADDDTLSVEQAETAEEQLSTGISPCDVTTSVSTNYDAEQVPLSHNHADSVCVDPSWGTVTSRVQLLQQSKSFKLLVKRPSD